MKYLPIRIPLRLVQQVKYICLPNLFIIAFIRDLHSYIHVRTIHCGAVLAIDVVLFWARVYIDSDTVHGSIHLWVKVGVVFDDVPLLELLLNVGRLPRQLAESWLQGAFYLVSSKHSEFLPFRWSMRSFPTLDSFCSCILFLNVRSVNGIINNNLM